MTAQQTSGTPKAPARGGRLVLAVLVLLGSAAGAVAGWWWWRGPTPQPPELALDGCEPAVARAIEAARARVIREPRSGAAWGKLGRLLLVHDQTNVAVPCFVYAERFDPDNPRWPYCRALVLLGQDPKAAVAPLRRAAELCAAHDPDNTAVRLRLAECLAELGRPDEAAVEFRGVLSRQPDNPRALYGLGLVAVATGELETARCCFEDCSGNPKTRKKAAAELARVLMRLGDETGAAAAQRRAQEGPLDSDWPDRFAEENSALIISRREQFRVAAEMIRTGKRKEGLALMRRLVREKPDHAGFLELGRTLASVREYPAAIAALREAARLDSNSFKPVYMLSALLFEQAEQSGAQELLREAVTFGRRAVALRPDHASAHVYLGLALKGQGQRKEALHAFRTAVHCAPDRSDPYLFLAEMLAEDGQKDEARRLLEQASRLPLPSSEARPRAALERLHKLLEGKSG
jgi:tetratricopeptide (TPR) repeat protein